MLDLSSNNAKLLLEWAREAIRLRLFTGDELKVEKVPQELSQNKACFVTLWLKDSLRGCIGTFDADKPLYQNVIRMAAASAFQDTRFLPLNKSELENLQIEISVLGDLEKVSNLEEIEVGRHGVMVRLGDRSGTFLPDVALDQKWSREEFVVECARQKAGLSPEDCAQAEIFRYEVQKLREA